ADQFRDQAVAQQIVRLDVNKGVLLQLLGDTLFDLFFCKADLPPAGARLDDLLEAVERAAANEQDVLRVDLDVLLLRMLAPTLRRDAGDRAFQNLEQGLLPEAGRTEQEDIALVELDVVVATGVGIDALVVVIHGYGESLLGAILPDHVLVQHVLYFRRRGDLSDRLRDFALFILRQDLI